MINIRTIKKLVNNEGLTLKNGKLIEYKTGWQVAVYGVEVQTAREAIIWFADGIYYIDKSFRVDTKREALEIGREHNQISIFGWQRKNLAYC